MRALAAFFVAMVLILIMSAFLVKAIRAESSRHRSLLTSSVPKHHPEAGKDASSR